MSLTSKFLLSISIIFISTVCPSEQSAIVSVCNSFDNAQQLYFKKDYRAASIKATVTMQQYGDSLRQSQTNPLIEKLLNFIIADCHIQLKSPQQALNAFEKIHDQNTLWGTITSEQIAQSLQEKAETLSIESILSKKLLSKTQNFNKIAKKTNPKSRLFFYAEKYKSLNIEELIDKLKKTNSPDKISIIISRIQEEANNNNMRALCVMVKIYNLGSHGIEPCQEIALQYACQYIQLLSHNPTTIPLEHFSIQKTLTELATNTSHPAYIPQLYYYYLQAIRNKNEHGFFSTIKKIKLLNDKQSPLRNIIIDILGHTNASPLDISKKITSLEQNKAFELILAAFINTDLPYLHPILANQLKTNTSYAENIHYILGLLFYHQQDYEKAKEHFKISQSNKTDLLTDYRIFNCNRMINQRKCDENIECIIELMEKCNTVSKKTARNALVNSLLCNELICNYKKDIHHLLNENNYDLTFRFTTILLQEKKIAPTIIKFIQEIQQTLLKKNNHDNFYAIPDFYNSELYGALNEICIKYHELDTYLELAQILINSLKNPTISPEIKDKTNKAISLYLRAAENHKLLNHSLHPKISSLYCELGKQLNNGGYLDKAIQYNNFNAYYEKAQLLLKARPYTKKIETTALDLLKKHATSNHSSSGKAYSELGKLYFDYKLQGKLLLHTPCNNTQAFNYLHQAQKLNDKTAIGLLGILYLEGIKNNNKWVVNPDPNLALNCFSQQLMNAANFIPEILYNRGITYYKNRIFGLALQDFGLLSLAQLPKHIKTSASLYKMAIKLKLFTRVDKHNEALDHLIEAIEEECNDFSIIDNEIQAILDNKIENIIINKNNTPIDYQWCHTIGKMYLKMANTIVTEKTKKLRAINYLQYAANNEWHTSQFFLGCLPQSDLPATKSISYLLKIYNHTNTEEMKESHNKIQRLISQRLPGDIIGHYLLISDYCSENNNDATLKYIESMFKFGPILLNLNINQECADAAIKSCTENNLLKELADKYILSPDTSTLTEENATIILGLIYSYSQEKTDLIKSTRYLKTLTEVPYYKALSIYLAISYYKLAMHFKKENIPLLSLEYLKKSADCKGLDAIHYIATEWLKNNSLVRTLSENQVNNWLQSTITLHNDQTSKILLNKLTKSNSPLKTNNVYQTASKEHSHQYLSLLIDRQESSYSKDKKYQQGISLYNTNTPLALKAFQSAIQKRPHPHAALMLAMHNTNTQLFHMYLDKSFIYGIIKTKEKQNSVFVDSAFLTSITCFIERLVKSNQTDDSLKTTLQTLLKKITDKGINTIYFKQFVLDTRNIDLKNYE